MTGKSKLEKIDYFPFAAVVAIAFLGNDLFGVADELLRLFTGLSEISLLKVADLASTILIVPSVIWGIWKRKKWSRWAFVGYYTLAILFVTAVIGGEIRESDGDRISMLNGYFVSITPSAIAAIYFGKSKSLASYFGYSDKT